MNLEAGFAAIYSELIRFGLQLKPKNISEHFCFEINNILESFLFFSKTNYSDEKCRSEMRKKIEILLSYVFIIRNFNPMQDELCLEIEKKLLELKLHLTFPKIKKKAKTFSALKSIYDPISEIKIKKALLKKRILAYIENRKILSSAELYNAFPEVSKREIRRLIGVFLQEGIIIRELETNKSKYRMNPQNMGVGKS